MPGTVNLANSVAGEVMEPRRKLTTRATFLNYYNSNRFLYTYPYAHR